MERERERRMARRERAREGTPAAATSFPTRLLPMKQMMSHFMSRRRCETVGPPRTTRKCAEEMY
eukprot:1266670-Rhodomonas_salina.1